MKKIDPSNALTKHLKSGPEHLAARLGLGIIDSSQLSLQEHTKLKIAAVKRKPWFPGPKLVFSATLAAELLQIVSSEKTGSQEQPIAVRPSTSLAVVHLTDSWLSTAVLALLAIYIVIHMVRDLYFAGKHILNCCNGCSIKCCRRQAQEEDAEMLLSVVLSLIHI